MIDVNLDAIHQRETPVSWLTAAQALKVLGVRSQTLYANVSRKKIRARPDPKDSRRSLYHEGDVRKLAQRHGGRRKAEAVAAGAIEYGDPVLPSAVSTIAEGRLWYRGEDAVALSESRTLEEIACLLWGADAVSFELASRGGRVSGSAGPVRATVGAVAAGGGPARAGGTPARTDAGPAGVGSSPARTDVGPAGVGGSPVRTDVGPARVGGGLATARVANPEPTTSSDASACRLGPETARLPLRSAFVALAERASSDPPSYGRALPVLQAEAAEVLATLAASLLGTSQGPSLHDRVAAAWGCCEAADLLRRVLVLSADHELNASTFATRVTVSTGASLAAGALAGLATLSGPLHGRASAGVVELIDAARREGTEAVVREWLARGRPISGFGHPLYPAGDVRATALLRQFALPAEYVELREVVEELVGERPNIDFALSALTQAYDLPDDAPLILFALARTVGWLAHALEQVTTGHLIRPRARYVGPPISPAVTLENRL